MNDKMDEKSINDRDTIKDAQGKKQQSNIGKAIALVILFSVCIYLAYSTLITDTKPPVEPQKEGVIKQTERFRPAEPKPVVFEQPRQNGTLQQKGPLQRNALLPKVELPAPTAEQPKSENDELLQAAQRAPVLAYTNPQQNTENTAKDKSVMLNKVDNTSDETAQQFNHLLKPTTLEGIRASALPNRNFIITMGTPIPCILETAINSDQQGFTSCIVSRDILSDNGRVVLLDKGTQIIGEYRGGLKKGQRRLFVLWTRAKTPQGVIIALASPATDTLGRSGMDGDVDNHWLERIGSALLVSIVRDATNYAKERLSKSQKKKDKETVASDETSSTVSSGQNIANILTENYANLPPTLTKNQGEMVNVFVARDLDFSNIYKLKVTENKKQITNRALSRNFYKKP
ncbi:type IV secretion system protein VirB10 [Bartonella sp. ML70XJBT.G]|uniref:type IV secretion system protein VirB10 n=1 Tax=Bartonella sp. ML70XJBT.G TaxID=3019093 RepID=UPI0023601B55|nr:type IV secretion system protein VirB10 [Bartonella sp. ML70XJBT.G]